MKRVYVTENGHFDKYGHFRSYGVLSVDTMLRSAVSYPMRKGCYRHQADKDSISVVIIYRQQCSNMGYRITCIDAF